MRLGDAGMDVDGGHDCWDPREVGNNLYNDISLSQLTNLDNFVLPRQITSG